MYEILEIAKKLNLSKKDISSINEYLIYDEWGIALEELCSAIIQDELTINSEQYKVITFLGNKMGFKNELWNDIIVQI